MKIVFVKLGDKPTPYLWLNLQKILRENKLLPVVLIVDKLEDVPNEILQQVEVFFYKSTPKTDSILDNLTHDIKFRNGFWRYSLERLFSLLEYHSENPNEQLLHIESDVLILKNFPWDTISRGTKLKWCRFNSDRDVASLVFLPNANESKWLMDVLVQQVQQNLETTDMRALSEISHLYPNRVEIFPYFNSKTQDLLNSAAKNLEVEIEASTSGDSFYDGIFDGAAIGMWLAGQDPQNNFGTIIYHDDATLLQSESYILPNQGRYRATSNGELLIECDGRLTPVYCLHIHSKQLEAFNEKSAKFINSIVQRQYIGVPIKVFSLKALLNLLAGQIRSGTLVRFLYGVSPVYKAKLSVKRKLQSYRVVSRHNER